MEDKFVKYSKLYALIFLLFLSIPVLLALIVFSFYGLSKVISNGPVEVAIELGMISLGPAVFTTAYFIFFKRTKTHPAASVAFISKVLFVIGIAISLFVLVRDFYTFFNHHSLNISGYYCFSLTYMAGNVASLFLIAIIQAFTTKKEVDWMDRNK